MHEPVDLFQHVWLRQPLQRIGELELVRSSGHKGCASSPGLTAKRTATLRCGCKQRNAQDGSRGAPSSVCRISAGAGLSRVRCDDDFQQSAPCAAIAQLDRVAMFCRDDYVRLANSHARRRCVWACPASPLAAPRAYLPVREEQLVGLAALAAPAALCCGTICCGLLNPGANCGATAEKTPRRLAGRARPPCRRWFAAGAVCALARLVPSGRGIDSIEAMLARPATTAENLWRSNLSHQCGITRRHESICTNNRLKAAVQAQGADTSRCLSAPAEVTSAGKHVAS
eukprot:266869-Prymnesium_polylepis.3